MERDLEGLEMGEPFKIGDRVYLIGNDVYIWMITDIIGGEIVILERRNERTGAHEISTTNLNYGAMVRAHIAPSGK